MVLETEPHKYISVLNIKSYLTLWNGNGGSQDKKHVKNIMFKLLLLLTLLGPSSSASKFFKIILINFFPEYEDFKIIFRF